RAGVARVDTGRAVVGLGDDRRKGGAREGDVHLVAHLFEPGLQHGERYRVQPPCRVVAHAVTPAATLMRRLPMASTAAIACGSTIVVASLCSTIAGPSIRVPGGKRMRSYTAAPTQRPSANSGRSPIGVVAQQGERAISAASGNGRRRPITEV